MAPWSWQADHRGWMQPDQDWSRDHPWTRRKPAEPARQRRARAKRSQARQAAEGFLQLQEHHASRLPRLLQQAIVQQAIGGSAALAPSSTSSSDAAWRVHDYRSQLLLEKLDRRAKDLSSAVDHLTLLCQDANLVSTSPSADPADDIIVCPRPKGCDKDEVAGVRRTGQECPVKPGGPSQNMRSSQYTLDDQHGIWERSHSVLHR